MMDLYNRYAGSKGDTRKCLRATRGYGASSRCERYLAGLVCNGRWVQAALV